MFQLLYSERCSITATQFTHFSGYSCPRRTPRHFSCRILCFSSYRPEVFGYWRIPSFTQGLTLDREGIRQTRHSVERKVGSQREDNQEGRECDAWVPTVSPQGGGGFLKGGASSCVGYLTTFRSYLITHHSMNTYVGVKV
jgi:hypothetical protein